MKYISILLLLVGVIGCNNSSKLGPICPPHHTTGLDGDKSFEEIVHEFKPENTSKYGPDEPTNTGIPN